MPDWLFEGEKDRQLVTPDWNPADPVRIEGVRTIAISNVLGDNGRLTEIWRRDWGLDELPVEQVFQKVMLPGEVSAWHAHRYTTDRLFCAVGRVKVVLFDGRVGSPSQGKVAESRLGVERPALVLVPPGVWHGVKALGAESAVLINLVDKAYSYEDPDHWRVPEDSPDIPYNIS